MSEPRWIAFSERLPVDDDFKSLVAVAERGLIEREHIVIAHASTVARHPNCRDWTHWTPLPIGINQKP